ncbi:Uncharacterised protein [Providencia rustigianii]|uniref:Uncharacterized protein n=2 Tax=Providencia rustigianii TaxID=158850 RepID=D1P564_9GAMM|nr:MULTISPECIES: hypothetical protein [Providencia]EFB71425.1 hypothetical protein PROVRUST_07369 [Providencia rustigianii DSM 4541]MTC57716.1 hypothetical protein [Providencia rustigianii]MTC59229.1 hypothetical protein [Providencia rustigianii]SPY77813.1 Uncharacterised protein [Providencia rustigianii]SUC27336.1 Uncharacterised protein [Providencia rustigianii]
MAMTVIEAKAKAAEISGEIMKQHIASVPGVYTSAEYKLDLSTVFERLYDSISKKMDIK